MATSFNLRFLTQTLTLSVQPFATKGRAQPSPTLAFNESYCEHSGSGGRQACNPKATPNGNFDLICSLAFICRRQDLPQSRLPLKSRGPWKQFLLSFGSWTLWFPSIFLSAAPRSAPCSLGLSPSSPPLQSHLSPGNLTEHAQHSEV